MKRAPNLEPTLEEARITDMAVNKRTTMSPTRRRWESARMTVTGRRARRLYGTKVGTGREGVTKGCCAEGK